MLSESAKKWKLIFLTPTTFRGLYCKSFVSDLSPVLYRYVTYTWVNLLSQACFIFFIKWKAENHSVLLAVIKLHSVLLAVIKLHSVLLAVIKLHSVLLAVIKLY